MLFSQARIAPGGPDIFDMQIPAGNAGQRKARAEYLPPSFAYAAIYENCLHIIFPGTIIIVRFLRLSYPGSHGSNYIAVYPDNFLLRR